MSFFTQMPLARKLVLTMMASSTTALLVAGAFFLSYDATLLRQNISGHLKSMADTTGANVAAALTYNDPKGAALVLHSVEAAPHIVAARIYDRDGKPFASYRRAGAFLNELPDLPPRRGSHLESQHITESVEIMFDGELIGYVYLKSDMREIQDRSRQLLWFVPVLMLASSAAAYLVAERLKRIISQPVLDLLTVTKTVSRERNFAVRATVSSQDEMGVLVEGFNEMLAQVQLGEDALRAAHAESELFINSVPSILIGIDNEGLVTRWNIAAASVFGMPAETIVGRPLGNCGMRWVDPELNKQVDAWFRVEKLEKRDNVVFERDGRRRFLGLTIINVGHFTGGKGTGFLITGADTTEQKALEEQLQQAQKLEAIGQLAAGIAHEINTPCQYVGDNARYLQQTWPLIEPILDLCGRLEEQSQAGPVTSETLAELTRCTEKADVAFLLSEIPQAITQTLEGVQRVSKIVRAMREFSHPGSKEKGAVDINHAIETTIAVARNEWKYVAEVETHFADNLPPVPCFTSEFNQVILNLLINAAHAIADVVAKAPQTKGTITVTTQREEDWAEVQVHDTGAGVPEHIRGRIFEPFFTTKPVGKGTGQGLALAYSVIVKKHHGAIWFESKMGEGTTFFIRLPLKTESAAQPVFANRHANGG